MEDNLSLDRAGDGSSGNASDGEQEVKLRPPPAAAAWFLTGPRLVPVRGLGVGDPLL